MQMKIGEVYAGGNLMDALVREGRLADAVRLAEPFVAISRESGDSYSQGFTISGAGWLLYLQGDLEGARKPTDEALAMLRKNNSRADMPSVLSQRAELLRQGDRLTEARKDLDEALATQQETKDSGRIAQTRVALARLSTEEGKPAAALVPVRQAREVFRKQGRLGDEIDSGAALAEAQLALGRTAEARGEIDAAEAAAKKSLDRYLRMQTEIVAARVRAAEGDGTGAARDLDRTLESATRSGIVPLQLDARLALGQIEMRSGSASSGRARLEALERDAGRRASCSSPARPPPPGADSPSAGGG
jgi:tetratricopeptide (TPR) repeat protein